MVKAKVTNWNTRETEEMTVEQAREFFGKKKFEKLMKAELSVVLQKGKVNYTAWLE